MHATASAGGHARPIFVVGYMHSGTTLVGTILGKHPSVFASKGESRFFEVLPTLRRQFRDLADDRARRQLVAYLADSLLLGLTLSRDPHLDRADGLPAAELDQLVEACRDHRDHVAIFRTVFELVMRRAGKTRWLERTPTHVFHVDQIVATIPGARVVEITRDVRDVLSSKKTRRATVWTTERYRDDQRPAKDLEKAYDPLWDTLSWKSAIAAGRGAAARHPERVMRVRYEELVANPEPQIRAMCSFLELDFDPAMVAVELKTTADYAGRDQRKGIYSNSVGRWRSTLGASELALCQTLARSELEALGLAIEPVGLRDKLEALALIPGSQKELLARLERRWRLGGLGYLQRVVASYGKRLATLARD